MAKTPHLTAEAILTNGVRTGSRLVVRDAYDVRDGLKARGYKFDQATLGWCRSFDGRPGKDFAIEVLHAIDSGYTVVVQGTQRPVSRDAIAAMVNG